MRTSVRAATVARAYSGRGHQPTRASTPGRPRPHRAAVFLAWATRKQARVPPTANCHDDDGWQDWPPDESSTEPVVS